MSQKIAVVSGASPGIGREIAFTLAGKGFAVRSITIDAADVESTHREAKERGLDVKVHRGDVSKPADVEAFRAWVGEGAPVKAVVNNAAIRPTGTVLTTTPETWDAVFAVNVKGTALVTQAFVPAMIAAGGGSIVVISSCSAMGSPNLVAYSSMKAALLAFSRCTAEDFRADRVRVNAILPGPIDSGMMKPIPQEAVDWLTAAGVQKRLGSPQDVASAVAFLVSDEAETISGTELRVNFWPGLFG